MMTPISNGISRIDSLVGLHVHRAAADDVQEKHRPLGGLLRAPLHRVEHPAHLPRRRHAIGRLVHSNGSTLDIHLPCAPRNKQW